MLVKAFCRATMYLYFKNEKKNPKDGMSLGDSTDETIQLILQKLEQVLKENQEIRDELANMNCLRSLMTKKEVAAYLKVTTKTIENLVNRKELFPIMVGSCPRFKLDEIERFLSAASSLRVA